MLVTLVVWGMFLGSLLPASGQEGPVGILYPRESESREVHSLDGVWNFRLSPVNDTAKGFTDEWYSQELRKSGDVIPMPVPASYNDITQDPEVRDFVGVVWYDRNFYVPSSWEGKRVWLRFGSVTYLAIVFVNGEHAVTHEIGHLPFKVEVTDRVNYGATNLITVAVNNTLYESSIPQGGVTNITTDQNTTEIFMTYSFDFFHYAGIDRPVTLYTTPEVYIDDISVITNIESQTGLVEYTIVYAGDSGDTDDLSITLILYDRDDQIVATSSGAKGELRIPDVNLWWPYLMHPDPAYLYTLQVNLTLEESDIYRLPVGVRTVSWNSTSLLINDKPFYFRGFGKHEDSDFKGKGLDLSIVTRDYNLIKWVGGNGYRTSHYPYAEEIMDFSDRQGIVIIDEVPIVDAKGWHEQLLENHLSSLTQLIQRDKNRPSVILWSVANEAATTSSGAEIYFKQVYDHVRSLDTTRGATQAINSEADGELAAQYSDVISVNTYSGWYSNTGQLHAITNNVLDRIRGFHSMHDKPVLVTEYGADAFSGLHVRVLDIPQENPLYLAQKTPQGGVLLRFTDRNPADEPENPCTAWGRLPETIWSEDYQAKLMSKYFEAFDTVRREGWFVGEMIWCFADFQTQQGITRVDGNKKGIFTRQRQPKRSAHVLRERYFALAQELDNATLPEDLTPYVSSTWSQTRVNTELDGDGEGELLYTSPEQRHIVEHASTFFLHSQLSSQPFSLWGWAPYKLLDNKLLDKL
uniref:Beta-glucuronidase n=1 Tax=Timema shepardi TaxID=629360 RepID=A0A7R9FWP1_TIMSH|nr:unnamed protein product [Timema shepardi]